MKKYVRLLCGLLALCCLLCACQTVTPTPTEPAKPLPPVAGDPNRPLPVIPEKMVCTTPAAGDLVLAENGKANATVVYARGGSKAEAAAKDLVSYLKKMTGADFTMQSDELPLPEGNLILVGPTDKTKALGVDTQLGYPGKEHFVIRRCDNMLLLCGNDVNYNGTQFAVTRFLEEAGCGWFSTEELWNVVPSTPTLAVKQWDQTFTPKFSTRTMSGVNSSLTNRWYCGGEGSTIGHTLRSWGNPATYQKDHPDWYALVNGLRNPASWWQFCYTNESFAQHIAQKVISVFDSNPTRMTQSIAANDGWNEGWCECENCKAAGNGTDQILVFANRVAEIVSQKYPDRTVSVLAYHNTYLPPLKTKAHPNVEVMFCLESSPLADFSSDYAIHDTYNGTTKVNYTQGWKQSCGQFIEETGLQHVSIWGWFCISGDAETWTGAPWVQGNVATRNIAQFEKMGVKHLFIDCTGEHTWIRWPLFYTFARSMWSDAPDAETILYDACIKLYGEAADEMFLFYRLLADSAEECVTDEGITWVPPYLLNVYGKNYNLIEAAVNAAYAKLEQVDPVQKERMNYYLSTWKYTKLVM